jgi:16S rRNA (uracil1498-N3)-methyltransferase
MADRYFVETPIRGAHARLVGGDAHHLAHVLRAKPGQAVTLFDGSGAQFDARVETVGRSEVMLNIVARAEEADRELTRTLTLAVSLPKGDRQRWLVEKVTELGVARVVPLVTARSVAQPVAAALARLRRAVIEASKQCGRNRLMEIAEAQPWSDFVNLGPTSAMRWIAHRSASDGESVIGSSQSSVFPRIQLAIGAKEIVVAIGPEGGFTVEEVAAALDAGWRQVDLGPRVLRVETAAIAVAAWVAFCAEGPQP